MSLVDVRRRGRAILGSRFTSTRRERRKAMTLALTSGDESPIDPVTTPLRTSPPYMAFPSFLAFLNMLQERGMPSVIDASLFGSVSKGSVSQTRQALRSLGLVDDDYRATDLFRDLVEADEETRRGLLSLIAHDRFPEAIELGRRNGTQGQLEEFFTQQGISGSTLQKAISFYLNLAEYANLPVSKYFSRTKPRPASNPRPGGRQRAGTTRRTTVRTKNYPIDAALPSATPVEEAAAPSGSTPLAEKRLEYIDMLMGLVRDPRGESVQLDLLDRIERLLGYEEASGNT
ncbi:hypothetical protein [Actinomycetospora atypica]|uniref:Uncharacterized protein n=1 Tax=Actinomycetospora atypica TaxID=1290095 RepID=A0ABV9YTK3_9PSEU